MEGLNQKQILERDYKEGGLSGMKGEGSLPAEDLLSISLSRNIYAHAMPLGRVERIGPLHDKGGP